jgi:hopanoid biosynthesis associated radical SAM protein HpnH
MISPAFNYEAVEGNDFLSRSEFTGIFQPIYNMRKRFRFYNTPLYLEFLAGKRDYQCTPWSTPTRNPKGWKRPCYLITDGHCDSFQELMEDTSWEKYGVGNDPRCANCMVHCGFEGSAIDRAGKSVTDMWKLIKWNVVGS